MYGVKGKRNFLKPTRPDGWIERRAGRVWDDARVSEYAVPQVHCII